MNLEQKINEALSHIQNQNMFLCYGLGSGHHLKELWSRHKDQIKSLVLIESDLHKLENIKSIFDWDLAGEQVKTFFGDDLSHARHFFEKLVFENQIFLKSMVAILAPDLTDKEEDTYFHFAKTLEEVLEDFRFRFSVPPEDSYYGFANTIDNLDFSATTIPFENLEGIYKNCPGILVASGPSLEHSLGWLKQAQEKSVLVACDSALNVLLNNDILPHFVCTLERGYEIAELYKTDKKIDQTALITSPLISPLVYQKYPGPVITQLRPIGQLRWFFPQHSFYQAGNSVSHMMLETLVHMGCSKIFLVGQDLAYHPYRTQSHVAGVAGYVEEIGKSIQETDRKSAEQQGPESIHWIKGNNGTQILTSFWYHVFHKILCDMMKNKAQVSYFNVIPASYGAKIHPASLIEPQNMESQITSWNSMDAFSLFRKIEQQCPITFDKNFIKQRKCKAIEHLDFFQSTGLSMIQRSSETLQKLDLQVTAPSEYDDFINSTKQITRSLIACSDDFFETFFKSQVQAVMGFVVMDAVADLSDAQSDTERVAKKNESYLRMVQFSILLVIQNDTKNDQRIAKET